MGAYKEKLIQYLEIKGYSPCTIRSYTDYLTNFFSIMKKPPAKITLQDITEYQIYLTQVKNASYGYFNVAVSAIKFFYRHILPKQWDIRNIPFRKIKRKLPVVISKQEIAKLIESVDNIKNKAIIQTLYSTGMRLAELQNLKIKHIDSKQMVIRIEQGKGSKDRLVMLSETLLKTLRSYYRAAKTKPNIFLFSGSQTGKPISKRQIQSIVSKTAVQAGLRQRVTPHVLRHSFATHLLEDGVNIRVIQKLLGHNSLRATAIYTHVAAGFVNKTKSPLDSLVTNTPEK